MDITVVKEVPLDEIVLQGINVRTDLDSPNSKEGLNELAESIKINGLMQPIVLRGEFGKPPYDVIVGQRRFLAHKLLGAKNIKATFSGNIDDINALLLSLSENLLRHELNYSDIAEAVTKLYNHFGKDEYKVKEKLGLSIRTIRSYIKIEEQATEKIKELLKAGKVSMADAKRAIDAAQGDKAKADNLVDQMAKLTRYQKTRVVEFGKQNAKASADEIIVEAEKPKLEETVIMNLPLKVHKALQAASGKLSVDPEEIAMNALVTWLKTNDFLVD
jgi:ParB family transcriptional regulator, chromosome partitioning protein